jgi:hypothetical protein
MDCKKEDPSIGYMILICFLFQLMIYRFMYIGNTEMYVLKDLFQSGKMDD